MCADFDNTGASTEFATTQLTKDDKPKLTDFGLVRVNARVALVDSSLTETTADIATPQTRMWRGRRASSGS